MLTLDDCIAFGELSRDVVLAIAECQSVPEMSAVAIGAELMQQVDGIRQIHDMIATVQQAALERGDNAYASTLRATLTNFTAEHPGIFS